MTIAQIQDALDTLIVATLPGYAKLSDSADVADNPNVYLNKGFATAFGSATRGEGDICNGLYVDRTFIIALTNTYNANLDADRRQDLEQALMADHLLLMATIEKNPTLTGVCVDSQYESDSGIEYIVDENYSKQYIGVISNVLIKYIERI